MAGKFEGNLAALARIKVSSLAKGVDKGGKILIPIMEYIPVREITYPV